MSQKIFAIRLPGWLWEEVQRRAETEFLTPSAVIRRELSKSFQKKQSEEKTKENASGAEVQHGQN
ncbi:hypothetical protein BECAL_02235 [Bellilinea caldifistulae]|uniref:CopG-like ribbon-helix-helix domain-containing protein n=1 Tax=Bellilinea caldifistulae TaxID=360411 RepID=A0A0P6WYV3_9CHLR|nr:hypothetical protein [Bellilinea caldifistulae]KPL73788.1 hypothetical protein AC812_13390 [Bellilinea caldifistulae]GAP11053.1 hypothetical protein BECAL_02235 [Bellilinea caldifistulae]